LRSWPLPSLDGASDKNARGTVQVLGGAASTPGAVLLAGLAALRVGAGKLAITTVAETAVALGVAVPEAKVDGVPAPSGSLVSCEVKEGPDAFVIGPGVLEPGRLVSCVASACADPAVVVDAVALHELPAELPARTVLTPNEDELFSLAGGEGPLDELALKVAAQRRATVVTRGWVAAPDGRLWELHTCSIALGTSGSGEVLAGIVG
jgi:NAD(P)H-hydrate repair Nnr-like enzyme with NAD(P)H-hydrate dehydratase domain